MHRQLLGHDRPFAFVPLNAATGSTACRTAPQWRAAAPRAISVSPHSPAGDRVSRMVKILELAFQLKITSLSLLPLRLVFRPPITSYSASLWMVKAEGRGDGLETTPGIYHGDRRSRTAVAQ